jgi:dienelactone hydrolase
MRRFLALVPWLALMTACPDVPTDAWSPHVMPVFDPVQGVVPQPNDLAMDPDTGLVSAPLEGLSPAAAAYFGGFMNTLDGFPLNSPISCLFTSDTLDPATVNADSVRVYDVTAVETALKEGKLPAASAAKKVALSEFLVAVTTEKEPVNGATVSKLVLSPKRPLAHAHHYAVLLTDSMHDTSGAPLVGSFIANLLKSRSPLAKDPDGQPCSLQSPAEVQAHCHRTALQNALSDADAMQLEPVRAFNDAILSALEAGDAQFSRGAVTLLWAFRTMSGSVAQFDPMTATIPTPNDLLRVDGHLAFPIADGDSQAAKAFFGWMNSLDGWSTVSVPVVSLTRAAVKESVTLTAEGGQPRGAAFLDLTNPEQVRDVEDVTVETSTSGAVRFRVAQPLDAGHTYLVALSRRIKTEENGVQYPLYPSGAQAFLLLDQPLCEVVEGQEGCINRLAGTLSDADVALLEPIRQAMQPVLALLEAQGIARDEVASLFLFTTMSRGESVYDPNASAIPLPNDLLRLGGRLNLPISPQASDAERELMQFMNSLDGWSQVQMGGLAFTRPLDPATVAGAFRFFTVQDGALQASEAMAALGRTGSREVELLPNPWFQPAAQHLVVVTKGLRDAGGSALVESQFTTLMKSTTPLFEGGHSAIPAALSGSDAAQLEAMRGGLAPLLDALEGQGVARDQVLAAWTFTSHSGCEALFSPSTGTVPFPNDVLLALDEEMHPIGVNLPIPADATPGQKAVLEGLRTLDGFSTLSPIYTPFSKELRAESLTTFISSGSIVTHLDEFSQVSVALADITPLVEDPDSSLSMAKVKLLGLDQVNLGFVDGQLSLAPRPGFPLEGGHHYMVVALDGLQSQDDAPVQISPVFEMARSSHPLVNGVGKSFISSLDDASAAALEVLRQGYAPLFEALESDFLKIERDRVQILWTFTTQGTAQPLKALHDALPTAPDVAANQKFTGTLCFNPALAGQTACTSQVPGWGGFDAGDIGRAVGHGRLSSHLLLANPEVSDPDAPKLGHFAWNADGSPKWNTDSTNNQVRVPFALALPKGAGPFPVVLFQHGLTGSKEDVWRLANRLAQAGYAVVATDAAWHGERALMTVTHPEAVFLSADLLATRDNFRQSVLDLFELTRVIRSGALGAWLHEQDPGTAAGVLSGEVYFLGESLGAMLGTLYAAAEDDVRGLVLNVPGAHFTSLITQTQEEWLKDMLQGIFAALGVDPQAPETARLMPLLQWALDPADPINFAPLLCSRPLEGHAKVPTLVQLASADLLMVPAITDELFLALEHEACAGSIGRTVYEGGHGFLTSTCAGQGCAQQSAARDEIVGFFDAHKE